MLRNPDLIHLRVLIYYRLDTVPPDQMKIGIVDNLFVIEQVLCYLIPPVFLQGKTG